MTHEKMIETVATRLNMDKEYVGYIVDRYLRTLSLRLKRREKIFDSKEDYYKGTYIVNVCNICYLSYSWYRYNEWIKFMKDTKSGMFADDHKGPKEVRRSRKFKVSKYNGINNK